eukprot:scaffold59497_cov79-Phaeocystis_antarctica.AAC.1
MVSVTGLRRGGNSVAADQARHRESSGHRTHDVRRFHCRVREEYEGVVIAWVSTRHEVPQPVVRGAKRVLYPKKCVGQTVCPYHRRPLDWTRAVSDAVTRPGDRGAQHTLQSPHTCARICLVSSSGRRPCRRSGIQHPAGYGVITSGRRVCRRSGRWRAARSPG